MKAEKNKKTTVFILMFVMLINALSYGTIIPLLYPYSARFGIDPTGLSLLFASFSLFQFLATPIIGRLSDRYGRKPLLVFSLLGTSISLALFASAQGVVMLFLARILDGITGGNNSVAQAVIADTHEPKERAQAFGLLGAAFGVGFLIGPAMGGLLSRYGLATPFWFASGLALVGTALAFWLLPETRVKSIKTFQIKSVRVFDFPRLWHALWTPVTGILLLITLIASIGQNSFILGFQSVTVDVLRFSPTQVGLIFTAFGLVNVLMQGFGIRYLLKIATSQQLLWFSLAAGVAMVGLLGFATTAPLFLIVLGLYMWIPPAAPFLSSLLSLATEEKDQGGVFGLSQAYTSIGQIVGPLLAGFVARWYVPGVFWLAAVVWLIGVVLVTRLPKLNKPANL